MNRYKVKLQKQQRKAYEDLFKQETPSDCSEEFKLLMNETIDPDVEKEKCRKRRKKIFYYLRSTENPLDTVSNQHYEWRWPIKKPQPTTQTIKIVVKIHKQF